MIGLLRYTAIGMITAIFAFACYLILPDPFVSHVEIEPTPREKPLISDSATQCLADTIYVNQSLQGYADREILDERCFSLQRRLADAGRSGDVQTMKSLMTEGANPNASAWPTAAGNGFEPVWTGALREKKAGAVKVLLDNGVEANDTFMCCMTHDSMLSMAVKNADLDMMRLLISRGADPDFVGHFGWGVMDAAEESGNAEIKSLILSACNASAICRVRTRGRKLGILLGITEKPE